MNTNSTYRNAQHATPNMEHRFQYDLTLLAGGSATVSVQQLVGSTYQNLPSTQTQTATGTYTLAFEPTEETIRIVVASTNRFALTNLTLDRDHVDTLVDSYALHAPSDNGVQRLSPVFASSACSGYRYGFQNQEKDDEIKGSGNSVNYTYRMHDTRLGRFFAVDPLTKKYPHYTPYSFSGNKVIHCIELEGLEEWNLSQGYTSMETFYGPFSNEYLNEQQGKVNYYDGLRTDASIALNKIEAQNIQITVYPMSLSPVIIYDVPIKIKRENSFAYAQVATLDDGTEEIWNHPGLGGKSHDFQASVLIHEYSAHYMEGVLNLIPDTDNVIFFDGMEENLMFNPNKPEGPNNPKMVQSWYSLGPVSTAKEEVNGWGLQKYLHESGILNYTQDEYNAVLKNVLNYVSKVDKLIKQEESNQLNEK